MATATFNDLYFGATEMAVTAFRTSVKGQRVTRYRWTPVNADGCITTGFVSTGFSSEANAIAAAQRHARFANVEG